MKIYIKNIKAFIKIYKDFGKIGARNWSLPRYIIWYTWSIVVLELKKLYKTNTITNR